MVIAVETPHPSPAETLRAEYGHAWDIWRELLPSGSHGDWIARCLPTAADPDAEPQELRASGIEALAEKLRGSER